MATWQEVMDSILSELAYRDEKWGTIEEHPLSVGEYLVILQEELQEAKDGWLSDGKGRNAALNEIVQVVSVGCACLCFHRSDDFDAVSRTLKAERDHQDEKWGPLALYPTAIAGYLLIIEQCLRRAIQGWMKNTLGRSSAISEIAQAVATGCACLEEHAPGPISPTPSVGT